MVLPVQTPSPPPGSPGPDHRVPAGHRPPARSARLTRRIALGLLLGVGLLVTLVWWARSRSPVEPLHAGRPLSYWLECLRDETNAPAGREALRAMAPGAAQYFFDLLNTSPGDTLVRQTYRSLRQQLPSALRNRTPEPRIQETLWTHDLVGYLNLIAPEAHQQVLAACLHPNPNVRYAAVLVTPQLGPWRAEAVPVVAALLADPNPRVRAAVANALPRIEADKSPALPALLQAIKSNPRSLEDHALARTIMVLGEIGPKAIEAAPQLGEFMRSSNTVLRVESAVALWRINRDTNAAACLISEIRNPASERDILWNLLAMLGAIGPEARPFATALQEKLASPPGSNSPPWLPTQLQIAINRITATNPPPPSVRSLRPPINPAQP